MTSVTESRRPFLLGLLMLLVLATVASAERVDVDFDVEPGQELVLDFQGARGSLDVQGWRSW